MVWIWSPSNSVPTSATLARRNLVEFSNARVEVEAFEEWQLPMDKFDAVVSASAFHWLDPAVRYSKSARPCARKDS